MGTVLMTMGICLIVWFNWESNMWAWILFIHTGVNYTADQYTKDSAFVLSTLAFAPLKEFPTMIGCQLL